MKGVDVVCLRILQVLYVPRHSPKGSERRNQNLQNELSSLKNLDSFGGVIHGLSLMPGNNQQQLGQNGWV